jgi:hypothetical protein
VANLKALCHFLLDTMLYEHIFLIKSDDKNFMKYKLIILTALSFVFQIHASLIEYSYTGAETQTGGGNQNSYTYSGIMIYDTGSSNVTFVSWRDWRGSKTYHSDTDTNLHFITITGLKSKTYTVMAGSGSETDTNGFYRLNDFMTSGENATLQIATGTKYVFPEKFNGSNNRNISPDDNGNEWLGIWHETMTFSASRSKSDNDQNLTSDEVANALAAELRGKGYSEQ